MSSVNKDPAIGRRKRRRRGQAISEYAMLLAFLAILIALVFAFAPGKLAPAISAAFSKISHELNDMANAADSASSYINILGVDIIAP